MKALVNFLMLCSVSLSPCLAEDLYSSGCNNGDSILNDSSTVIEFEVPFVLFGEEFRSSYINIDGVLSFTSPLQYNSSLQNISTLGKVTPVVAPFWSDIEDGTVCYRNSTDSNLLMTIREEIRAKYSTNKDFEPTFVLVITWDRVGHYNLSTERKNSFQTILITNGNTSFVMFIYSMLSWTQPDSRDGSNDSEFATAGFANSNISFSLPDSGTDQIGAARKYLYRVDYYHPDRCNYGDIRLNSYGNAEVSGLTRGRVEVCFNEEYGTVCDDSWNNYDASVVCRQLGFSPFGAIPIINEFSPDDATIATYIRYPNCTGEEIRLQDCINDQEQTCSQNQIVSVSCEDQQTKEGNCMEGEIRLTGGNRTIGILEVCINNAWGAVCDTKFGSKEAQVVCHQLKFPVTDATSFTRAHVRFGLVSGPIFLEHLSCSGNENNILECPRGVLGLHQCDHTNLAGVQCYDENQCSINNGDCEQNCINLIPGHNCSCYPGYQLNNDGRHCDDVNECMDDSSYCEHKCTNTIGDFFCDCYDGYILFNDSQCRLCSNGELRLVDGNSSKEGRVEVCYNGSYYTVCDDHWDELDARVVCRQLNFTQSLDSIPVRGAFFGEGSSNDTILLDDVFCNGTETVLLDCPRGISDVFMSNCEHSEDAGVICESSCIDGSVRLVVSEDALYYYLGQTEYDSTYYDINNGLRVGRVEICVDGNFGSVCEDGWDYREASVVCNQLGYSKYGALAVDADVFREGIAPKILTSLNCSGNETNLLECDRVLFSGINCPTSGVICQDSSTPGVNCQNGEIKLSDFTDNELNGTREGRVEICLNNAWGTVCNRSFDEMDAITACSNLEGFKSQDAEVLSASSFVKGSGPIYLSELGCDGSNNSLLECPRGLLSPAGLAPDCDHSQDAGVLCHDIDECAILNGGCDHNCTNLIGGHNCSCMEGFELLSNNLSCNDTDECLDEIAMCHLNATCENFEGGFNCSCDIGYIGDGFICDNIDECIELIDDCHDESDALCMDNMGSFSCICREGFQGNGTYCEDIDECMTDSDDCDTNAVCINEYGGFNCSCNPGYSGNGSYCEDINECTSDLHNCDANANCSNTEGSFNCTCLDGYEGNGTIDDCRNINECLDDDDNNCHVNATCTDNIGSFGCDCFSGFTGYGVICEDIDECYQPAGNHTLLHNCSSEATCYNRIGDFFCSCNAGFRGDGVACEDIDECEENSHDCHEFANCNNTFGNFSCSCLMGYEGNGTACNCDDGDVLLMNGTAPTPGQTEGRVEICYQNIYRTICDDYWDISDAQVICRQLNFTGSEHFPLMRADVRYGNGSGPILLDNLMCNGDERTLIDCIHNEVFENNCARDHSEDAGVVCNVTCNGGYSRLVNDQPGARQVIKDMVSSGTVEMCLDGIFRSVCDDGWDNVDASVLCKEIGFSEYGAIGRGGNTFSSQNSFPGYSSVRCIGNETSLSNCPFETTGPSMNCEMASAVCQDVGVNASVCKDGDLQLLNGGDRLQGRLEICINRAWGSICNEGFGIDDAEVVCRKLGLLSSYNVGKARVVQGTQFGTGSGPIFLDNLGCNGNEANLLDCRLNINTQPRSFECSHNEDVGVICPDTNECRTGQHNCSETLEDCRNTVGSFDCECKDGYTRNANTDMCEDINECDGTNNCTFGECQNLTPQYMCVCDSGYRNLNDTTTCTDLCEVNTEICDDKASCRTYSNNTAHCKCDPGFRGNGSIGYCEDMNECADGDHTCDRNAYCINTFGSFTCHCQPGFIGDGSTCECKNHTIRLINGMVNEMDSIIIANTGYDEKRFCKYQVYGIENNEVQQIETIHCHKNETEILEGRVEICFDNEYTTVCDDQWDQLEAMVICRQLGHNSTDVVAVKRSSMNYGSGEGRIILDNLECFGNESDIFSCQMDTRSMRTCTHDEDAGVRCGATCEDGDARIIVGDGYEYYTGFTDYDNSYYIENTLAIGRIELCSDGNWKSVCRDVFTREVASVACYQLGFSRAGAINGSDRFRPGDTSIPLNTVMNCTGEETELRQCPRSKSNDICDQFSTAYVICQALSVPYTDCTHGEVRLTNGTNVREGRVEICVNNVWGTVCSTQFSNRDASVICAQMNFNREGSEYLGEVGDMGKVINPIVLGEVDCDSMDQELLECNSSPLGIPTATCTHDKDVMIRCNVSCPSNVTISSYGSYHWNPTLPEETVLMQCMHTIDDNRPYDNRPYARRYCNERGVWEEINFEDCYTLSESMLLTIETTVSPQNIELVLNDTRDAINISTTPNDQSERSLAVVSGIISSLSNCTQCHLMPKQVRILLNVLESIQNWEEDTLNSEAAVNIGNIEKILENAVFPVNKSTSSISFSGREHNLTDLGRNGISLGPNNSSIQLPESLFNVIPGETVQLAFGTYQSPMLFSQPSPNNNNFVLASSVVSASVLGENVTNLTNLTDNVVIDMVLHIQPVVGPKCVFWNSNAADGKGDWSDEGCSMTGGVENNMIKCSCNHLSTFGVLVNTNPIVCDDGLEPDFSGTGCNAVKPNITVTSENGVEIAEGVYNVSVGSDVRLMCVSSGEFQGKVMWRMGNHDVPEINASSIMCINGMYDKFTSNLSGFSLDLLEEDVRSVLLNESAGQLYAYRCNDTMVILGTRRSDVFGVSIGVDYIASGAYECVAENQNSSNHHEVNITVIEDDYEDTTYIRFSTTILYERLSSEYFISMNSENLTSAMFSYALLTSFNNSQNSRMVNCSQVASGLEDVDNNRSRIECDIKHHDSIAPNVESFLRNLPRQNIIAQEENGINISVNGFCDNDLQFESSKQRGFYTWTEVIVNETSTDECYFNSRLPDNSSFGKARRTCYSHLNWTSPIYEYNGIECITNETFQLRLLSMMNITADNAGNLVSSVADVIQVFSLDDQNADNFNIITTIYDGIDNLIADNGTKFQVTSNFTSVTLDILNSVSIWPENSVATRSSNLVNSFETVTMNLIEGENFTNLTIIEKNVNLQVSEVKIDDSMDSIIFPRLKGVKNVTDTIPEAIEVQSDVLNSSNYTIFSSYEESRLFQIVPPTNNDSLQYVVDSVVLGLILTNGNFSNLKNPIKITLQSILIQENMNWSSPRCASWDFKALKTENNSYRGNWSLEGCSMNMEESNTTSGIFVCECSHLTNFAVLMNVNPANEQSKLKEVFSIIGSVLSIIGLLLSLFTLIYFRTIRSKDVTIIHIQLCVALLLLFTVFVIGIDLIDEGVIVCSMMSLLIQYTALASIFWMGAEAVFMIKKLVLPMKAIHISRKFYITLSLICWGVPTIFPAITLIASLSKKSENYLITESTDSIKGHCFIDANTAIHYSLFLVPLIIVLIFNFITLIIVTGVVIRANKSQKRKTDFASTVKVIVGLFSVMTLFGIFWIIGIFSINVVFEWLFLLTATFQGIILFFFFGLINGHKEWKNLLTCSKERKKRKLISSLGPSKGSSNSKSKEIITITSPVSLSTTNFTVLDSTEVKIPESVLSSYVGENNAVTTGITDSQQSLDIVIELEEINVSSKAKLADPSQDARAPNL